MSERLQELQRQRALLAQHLAWLDREIAAEQGVPQLPSATPTFAESPPLAAPAFMPPAAKAASRLPANNVADAEKIIGQFQKDPSLLKTDTRRGCLVFFGVAVALFILATIIAYWLYARHLGRWW